MTSQQQQPRLAIVYHPHMSGHHYSIARLVDIDGEMFAVALPQGKYRWESWQFTNKAKAFKAAGEAGDVHPDIVVQDYTQRHCFAVKRFSPKAEG